MGVFFAIRCTWICRRPGIRLPPHLARDDRRPLRPRTAASRSGTRSRARFDHAGLRFRRRASFRRRPPLSDEQPRPTLGAEQERRRLCCSGHARDFRLAPLRRLRFSNSGATSRLAERAHADRHCPSRHARCRDPSLGDRPHPTHKRSPGLLRHRSIAEACRGRRPSAPCLARMFVSENYDLHPRVKSRRAGTFCWFRVRLANGIQVSDRSLQHAYAH